VLLQTVTGSDDAGIGDDLAGYAFVPWESKNRHAVFPLSSIISNDLFAAIQNARLETRQRSYTFVTPDIIAPDMQKDIVDNACAPQKRSIPR